MRLLERVILKCEGSVVLKAIESTECVGDSEKARLGNIFSAKPTVRTTTNAPQNEL